MAVSVDANRPSWQFYTSGIIKNNCQLVTLNHGVLAVGWGVEDKTEYFLLKNNWGTRWGDKGYIKVATGLCGVCAEPVFLELD